MLKFKSFLHLIEELTDYQKMKVDMWKKTSPTVANQISNHLNFTNDRLEIPFDSTNSDEIHPDVRNYLSTYGYNILDNKYAEKKIKTKQGEKTQKIKIGKILPPGLQKTHAEFGNKQSKKSNLKIVISRHPYDVAGMSTDRGWTSCMDMDGGCENHHLSHDIKNGTHVAYLVHKNDDDIKNPLARIALKPYIHQNGHTVLRPETKTYGTGTSKFESVVNDWTDKNFPTKYSGAYNKAAGIYDDSGITKITHYNKDDIDKAFQNEDYWAMMDILKNTHLKNHITSEHLDKALNHHNNQLVIQALKHPNITSEHLDKALNNENGSIRFAALSHPNITPNHINKGLEDEDLTVAKQAIQHPNANSQNIHKALDSKISDIRRIAIQHPNVNSEHISKGLNDDLPIIRKFAMQLQNILIKH